ncbi:MAG: alginate lyase family protein, partial [Actinobacteria bacterium]|nr:alginate lyase family protein [Actinomycetota bacterium]
MKSKLKTKIESLKNILSTPLHLLIFKIVHRLAIKIRDFFNFKRAKNLRLSDEYEKLFLKDLSFYNSKGCSDKYDFINSIFAEILKNECWDRLINFEEKKFIEENLKNGQMIIKNADLYSSHIFNLLGSGKVKVSYRLKPEGVENNIKNCINKINHRVSIIFKSSLQGYGYDPIDWHIDFKSGYRWDNKTWYRKIKFGTTPGADVKVPWELSRCYHFLTLGQAYFITGDEKYTKEFIYQFIDWVENNPIQFGVNWVCTMDVAIRACNWILSFLYFKNSKLINKEFLYEFIKNIFIHGLHIRKNLEKDPFSPKTNHYISNLAGLIYIGRFLNNLKFGKALLDFAIRELNKEVQHQVYNDGSSFEASTCYHRLVLELLFYPVLFLTKSHKEFNGYNFKDTAVKIFGDVYIKKIFKMFEVLKYCLNPDGYIPQIGDNDNGRLHIFGYPEMLDATYLLQIASVFFNESSFKILRKDEILWIFGKTGSKIWDNLNGVSIKSIESHAFLNVGWFILRKNNNFLMISAGQNGQGGNGGHAHNDKLSFELCINGKNIIVDPGTYLYTGSPEWRNKFRSTAYHNTVSINNQEQNRFVKKSLFLLNNDSNVKIKEWTTNEYYDLLDAEHYGFTRSKNPIIHQRQIIFDKKNIRVYIK